MLNWLIGKNEIEQRDFTIKIELENHTEPQELILPKNYGVYQVFIEPLNDLTAPSAIFHIGRNHGDSFGQISRIISVRGKCDGQLDMNWPNGKFPHLQYKPTHYIQSEELKELDRRLKNDYSVTEFTDINKKRQELIKNQPKVEYQLRFIGV